VPVVSKAQNRFFQWAATHPEESGVKPAVSREFLEADHGRSLKGLPEHVEKKADGGHVEGGRRPFKW
jgi:hypothetical protein